MIVAARLLGGRASRVRTSCWSTRPWPSATRRFGRSACAACNSFAKPARRWSLSATIMEQRAANQRSSGLDRGRATGRHRRACACDRQLSESTSGPLETATPAPVAHVQHHAESQHQRFVRATTRHAGRRALRTAKRLNLAVIIPELAKYGGAERYLDRVRVALAGSPRHHDLLVDDQHRSAGRARHRQEGAARELSPYFEGQHSILLNTALLPKIWEQEIGKHDMYHTHLWPTHLIDLHPMVWYPHEPLRILHDLRYEQPLGRRGRHAAARAAHLSEVQLRPHRRRDLRGLPVVDGPGRQAGQARPRRGQQPLHGRLPGRRLRHAGARRRLSGRQRRRLHLPAVGREHLSDDRAALAAQADQADHRGAQAGRKRAALHRGQRTGKGKAGADRRGHGSGQSRVLPARADQPGSQDPLLAGLGRGVHAGQGAVWHRGARGDGRRQAADRGQRRRLYRSRRRKLRDAGGARARGNRRANALLARQQGHRPRRWARPAASACKPTPGTAPPSNCWTSSNPRTTSGLANTSRPRVDATVAAPRCSAPSTTAGTATASARTTGTTRRTPAASPTCRGWATMPRRSCSTIEAHWRLFDQMGLDFVVLNLHVDRNGTNAYEQAAAESIFSVVDRLDTKVRLAIQICPYDCTREQLAEAIETDSPRSSCRGASYFHYDGEPVLFYFWTGVQDGNKPWINFVDDSTQGFLRIASSLRMYSAKEERRHSFGLFHGWSLYSPLELSAPANWERVWRQAYREQRRRHAQSEDPVGLARLRRPSSARPESQDQSAPQRRPPAGRRVSPHARLRLLGRRRARHGADLDVQRVSREHAHRAVAQSRLAVSEHDAGIHRGRKAAMEQMMAAKPAADACRCPMCWSISSGSI